VDATAATGVQNLPSLKDTGFVGNKATCHTATPTSSEWQKNKNLQVDKQPRSEESGMFSRSIRDLSRLGSELS
jgi:hypothetical protein